MEFAEYVALILLCKHGKFGEKIYYNSGDIEFFLGVYFFGATCRLGGVPCFCVHMCAYCIFVLFLYCTLFVPSVL